MYSYFAGGFFVKILRFLKAWFDWMIGLVFSIVYHGRSRPLPPITSSILMESAVGLARKIRLRELSSHEVVSAFISRIKNVNGLLNAVVDERFSAALQEARDLDEFLCTAAKGEEDLERLSREKPFLGVPFTIKENFQVTGLRQTVGLMARKNHVSTADADAVVAMRNSGAILLGVTNISELCTWWESRNKVYGQTSNPYDTTRVAGGSSGGEGSIIGVAGSVMGIGSDIGGSIRIPAFFNGIYGHKPSPGIISNVGQLPEALGDMSNFLTTGPLCRYGTDLMPLFALLAGPCAATALKLDLPVNVKELKIYYMEDDGGFPLISDVSKELRSVQQKVVEYFLRVHGVESQKVSIPEMERSLEIWGGRLYYSGAPTFCEEMVEKKFKLNIYTEFLRWCIGKSEHTVPAIGLGLLEKLGGLEIDRAEIASLSRTLEKKFEKMLRDDGIFLYPSFPTTAPFHYQPLLSPFDFSYQSIFNILGLPVTQCPLGLSRKDGMPVGIQVVSAAGNDRLCLAMAVELEKGFGGWVPPCDIVI